MPKRSVIIVALNQSSPQLTKQRKQTQQYNNVPAYLWIHVLVGMQFKFLPSELDWVDKNEQLDATTIKSWSNSRPETTKFTCNLSSSPAHWTEWTRMNNSMQQLLKVGANSRPETSKFTCNLSPSPAHWTQWSPYSSCPHQWRKPLQYC